MHSFFQRRSAARTLITSACMLLMPWAGVPAAAQRAPESAYDERADAKADLAQALAQAAAERRGVLVVFGANWCPDCKVLDLALKEGRAKALVDAHWRVVKVDVGKFDRNVDVAERYGVPLKKGIPAVVLLDGEGRVRHATMGGELADARRMGESGLHDYFARLVAAEPRRP